ncbi:hypothetical protein [Novosphingopyxis sp. YJ-S2-01]|uniref:hypothetical protein n=1 Tax=Novosphingopyxis sp. YJ-S2-01 TaxID=2794021 RepID=UPI0018DC9A69|nr:hypothetical protein [Novosphingopyxis sp. YJ-S2-01]MBH9537054.1 hypothetical protein [Novosphingopyxis sp. YJ-S2-01]
MKGEEFVAAVTALVEAHPDIRQSGDRHPAHCNLYSTAAGPPIATEPERKRVANIWVRADSVRRHRLAEIESEFFEYCTFDISKPNHNLFREPGFKDADLIRFQVSSLWQAVQVISEVAGDGS